MKRALIFLPFVAILLAAFVWAIWPDRAVVDSYDTCVHAGYPVMESYPQQCRTPDGHTFVQSTPAVSPQMRSVSLYYYDAERDRDAIGNIQCSRQGLVTVQRDIPWTNTPIQDTVRLLLRGALTDAERAQGITTEYPLPGLLLTGASLSDDGILTLSFDDPQNRTGGGSCRIGILWAQINATAQQFAGITHVRFMPEELFQP